MSGEDSRITTIKLADGRIVDFVGKRKAIKSTYITESGQIHLRIDFRNGETRDFALNPNLVTKFAAHGAEQKYGDEWAGVEDVDDMVLAVDELHSRLEAGDWSVKRESGGIAGTSVLVRALVEYSGKSVDEVKKYLSDKSQPEKMALRANAKIRPIVERIESEKLSRASKVDSDQLLSSLQS